MAACLTSRRLSERYPLVRFAAVPRGPRKLALTFGAQNLTHYSGVCLLHRFLTRIGFKDAVAQRVRFTQRNNRYSKRREHGSEGRPFYD